jgi:DNA-binding SARP family transcriptional activator/tetratricopeptide (TPR) repeat protein
MEFRVLGPVEAVVDETPVELGRRRERLLLAVLLLNPNQPVSVERLADLLWCDGQNPRDAVYVSASRLRKQLRAAHVELSRSPAGYTLVVDPGTVDAHRFTRYLDQARRAADPATRADLLHQALRLWRGPALADVASGELRERLCAGLEEQRLTALESRVEADLALGRQHDLVAELAELATAHPERERLVAARMLALYRAGRQNDALTVYRQAATTLAATTGLDPGPALTTMQVAILRNDPMLAADGNSRPPQAHPRPAQLPTDLATFTGREAELDALLTPDNDDECPSAVVISAIDGMAGIGKSALAVHAAHRLASRFPDGQLFVDLHGHTPGMRPVDPVDALDHMLRSLGAQIPHTVAERAALLRTTLHGQRVLVVLDNALDAAQVRPLLPGTPGCLVLVTSRRRLADLDDARPISLDLLPTPDAVTLFERTAGADRLAGQPAELVTEIVALCGWLPLAIRIAAARLRHRQVWTLTDLVERLRDQQHRLAELRSGERSITAAIDVSYSHLDPRQQQVFRLLRLHPGPDIDAVAVAALTGLSEHDAARLLDDLLDVHLLQQRQPGRYRFHDLVGEYAAAACARLDPPGARQAAVTRLSDHYARTASAATDVAYPHEADQRPRLPASPTPVRVFADRVSATTWLDAELTNLFAIAHHDAAHTLHLSETLQRHLRTRGRYTEAEALHDHALRTARRTGNRRGEQDALNRLGHVHRMREQHETAVDCFQHALLIARAEGDRGGEHDALLGLGHVHRLQGRYAAATETYRQVLVIARALGNHSGELITLVSLGHTQRVQGQHDSAIECLEQALAIARAINDANGECTVLDAIGDLAREQGRYELAIEQHEQSLAIARRQGHRVGELNALWGLGHAHRLHGELETATAQYQEVLDVSREIGHHNSEFEAHYGLGQLALATGHPEQAAHHHSRALDIACELDQLPDQARAHAGTAAAHHAVARSDLAHPHWQRCLTILTDLNLTNLDEVNAEHIRTLLAKA